MFSDDEKLKALKEKLPYIQWDAEYELMDSNAIKVYSTDGHYLAFISNENRPTADVFQLKETMRLFSEEQFLKSRLEFLQGLFNSAVSRGLPVSHTMTRSQFEEMEVIKKNMK